MHVEKLRTRVGVGALLLFACAGSLSAQEPGHIQVKCAPGVAISLDGTPQGTSSLELGGLIIQNVTPGTHTLRAEKYGFVPQEERLRVAPGQVVLHEIRSFVPATRITEEGLSTSARLEAGVGTLIIQSLPVACTVNIPSAGLNGYKKTQDKITVESVAVGQHAASFSGLGKTIQRTIALNRGQTLRILANLLTGEVTVAVVSDPRSVHVAPAPRPTAPPEPARVEIRCYVFTATALDINKDFYSIDGDWHDTSVDWSEYKNYFRKWVTLTKETISPGEHTFVWKYMKPNDKVTFTARKGHTTLIELRALGRFTHAVITVSVDGVKKYQRIYANTLN